MEEFPQAPCLSVSMFTIFWMSCVPVIWSLYLAARIKWSHIFSSSRFSAAYWAHWDWRKKTTTDLLHVLDMRASWQSLLNCSPKVFQKCTIQPVKTVEGNTMHNSMSHIWTSVRVEARKKAWVRSRPYVMLINHSGRMFFNAPRHTNSHDTFNTQGGHFSLSEFVIRRGLWTVQPCWNCNTL